MKSRLSIKRVRTTARQIFDRIGKKKKKEEEMQDENDKDVAEEKMGNEVDFLNCYDNIAESIFDETDEDSRRRLWRKLSEKDLRKLMFLLSTTQSKTAVNEYFDTEMLENQKIMKELLFRSEHLKEIEMCSTCAEDGEKCSCFNISSKCTVVFSDLSSLIRGMLQINGKHVLNVQSSIVRGECTTSPMGHGILKERLLNELTPGEVKVHFQCGFDGIKLHMKGRYKVWPFTLIPLDLEDKERATVRSVLTCAMYIGKTDPSANVHDRIINWCQNEMSYPISWNGLVVYSSIVCGAHDDSARRKIYSLKSHSSKGSCPFCLNQSTVY